MPASPVNDSATTNLLLTGRPGVGKTTIVRQVIQQLSDFTRDHPVSSGPVIGGFITREIRERKQRIGFEIASLDTNEVSLLAHVRIESPYRVGKFAVRIAAMTDVAVPALQRALCSAELIVIDEIGRMESFAPEFLETVVRCLDSDRPLLGVIPQKRLPFLDAIRDREDVELLELTDRNRNLVVAQVLERARQWRYHSAPRPAHIE